LSARAATQPSGTETHPGMQEQEKRGMLLLTGGKRRQIEQLEAGDKTSVQKSSESQKTRTGKKGTQRIKAGD
jgi:hypothetical protein